MSSIDSSTPSVAELKEKRWLGTQDPERSVEEWIYGTAFFGFMTSRWLFLNA